VDRIKSLILVVALFAPGISFAAYTNATPPTGWVKNGTVYTQNSAKAFAAAEGLTVNAWLQAGGRTANLPAVLPLAEGAAKTAAGLLFRNPYLQGALLVGGWLAGECLSVDQGVWKITCGPSVGTQSDGFEYRTSGDGATAYYPTAQQSCSHFVTVTYSNETWAASAPVANAAGTSCNFTMTNKITGATQSNGTSISKRSSSCQSGYYYTSSGCVQTPTPVPISQTEFENKLANKPMPAGLPASLPGDYPVQLPSIQPMQIPMGSPVAVPNTSPTQYQQPIVTVTPAPTTDSPWRVNVEPGTLTGTSPTGITNPQPATTTAGSSTDTDFCLKHPNSHVCQDMGSLDPVDVPNQDIQLAITPDTGWGPNNASCPAPKTVTVQGKTLSFSLQMVCDAAVMIRPLFIGFAWITAVILFVGMARKGE
jgi:hypothetical protein